MRLFSFSTFIAIFAAEKWFFVQTIKQKIFSIVLLALVLFNIGVTTLFVHQHRIDERVVVHSHPFRGNSEAHDHSASSLLLVARQAITEMSVAESLRIDLVDEYIEAEQMIHEVLSMDLCDTRLSALRAPPVA